jgi:hypothetical protein
MSGEKETGAWLFHIDYTLTKRININASMLTVYLVGGL